MVNAKSFSGFSIGIVIVVSVALVSGGFLVYNHQNQEPDSPIVFKVEYEDGSNDVLTDGDSETYSVVEKLDGTMAMWESSDMQNKVDGISVVFKVKPKGVSQETVEVSGQSYIETEFLSFWGVPTEYDNNFSKTCTVGEWNTLDTYSNDTMTPLNEGKNELNAELTVSSDYDGKTVEKTASGKMTLYVGEKNTLSLETSVSSDTW